MQQTQRTEPKGGGGGSRKWNESDTSTARRLSMRESTCDYSTDCQRQSHFHTRPSFYLHTRITINTQLRNRRNKCGTQQLVVDSGSASNAVCYKLIADDVHAIIFASYYRR